MALTECSGWSNICCYVVLEISRSDKWLIWWWLRLLVNFEAHAAWVFIGVLCCCNDWAMETWMRRMVSHLFFCLEWFLWMCFGVDCGLCVGCFPDLWCCAENPSFPALGNTCVFSRFDDPACALSRTSKYQIWVYRCARRHTFLRHISMNQLNMSLLIYYDRSVATCRPRS